MVESILVLAILLILALWVIRLWAGAMRGGSLGAALRLMGESLAQIFRF